VDLFPLVRKSIRVGTENYSLKSLEPLYMGAELRAGDVTTATDSITGYARYCELLDDGRTDEATVLLKEIEEYNRYDCRSTRKLRDWLITRAIEASVPAQPLAIIELVGVGGLEQQAAHLDELHEQAIACLDREIVDVARVGQLLPRRLLPRGHPRIGDQAR